MIIRSAKEVGALVRDRRTRLKLSQETLAQKVGVSRAWIIDLEQGKSSLQFDLALRALTALGVILDAEVNAANETSRLNLDNLLDL